MGRWSDWIGPLKPRVNKKLILSFLNIKSWSCPSPFCHPSPWSPMRELSNHMPMLQSWFCWCGEKVKKVCVFSFFFRKKAEKRAGNLPKKESITPTFADSFISHPPVPVSLIRIVRDRGLALIWDSTWVGLWPLELWVGKDGVFRGFLRFFRTLQFPTPRTLPSHPQLLKSSQWVRSSLFYMVSRFQGGLDSEMSNQMSEYSFVFPTRRDPSRPHPRSRLWWRGGGLWTGVCVKNQGRECKGRREKWRFWVGSSFGFVFHFFGFPLPKPSFPSHRLSPSSLNREKFIVITRDLESYVGGVTGLVEICEVRRVTICDEKSEKSVYLVPNPNSPLWRYPPTLPDYMHIR